jgi:hypothetical protein
LFGLPRLATIVCFQHGTRPFIKTHRGHNATGEGQAAGETAPLIVTISAQLAIAAETVEPHTLPTRSTRAGLEPKTRSAFTTRVRGRAAHATAEAQKGPQHT